MDCGLNPTPVPFDEADVTDFREKEVPFDGVRREVSVEGSEFAIGCEADRSMGKDIFPRGRCDAPADDGDDKIGLPTDSTLFSSTRRMRDVWPGWWLYESLRPSGNSGILSAS